MPPTLAEALEPALRTTRSWWPKWWALHVYSLFGFAVAQPVFSLLEENPGFLVAHDAQPLEVFSLVLLLCLILPSLLVGTSWAVGTLRPVAGVKLHQLQMVGLFTLFSLQFLNDIEILPGTFLLAFAIALGVGFAVAYRRFAALRLMLTYLTPGILLFPLLFLLHPRIHPLAFPPSFEPTTAEGEPAGGPPVILLVFDELPLVSLLDGSRNIGAQRYPNFAALAKESHWFRNGTTVADNTHYAVPALLTGKVPDEAKRSMTFADYPQNLFTLLAHRMELQVFETISQFCPQGLCSRQVQNQPPHQRLKALFSDLSIVYLHLVSPPSFARRLPDVTSTWRDFLATAPPEPGAFVPGHQASPDPGDIPRLFANFLESFKENDSNTFYYLHINIPHIPWKYLPSGLEYGPLGVSVKPRPMKGITWIDDEWQVLQEQQRHLLQVVYADRLLGDLLDRLDAVGLRDEVLLMVTSDHGASFRPGEFRRRLSDATYQDVLPVPFFIKEPGQREGTVNDRNVETIDILPTVASFLGLEVPWSVDGQDLFDPSLPDRTEKLARRPGLSGEQGFVGEALLEKKFESADRLLETFGESVDSLFTIGPWQELLGRALEDLEFRPGEGTAVELVQPWLLTEVDRSRGFLPARLQGTLRQGSSELMASRELAVAVNGEIRAVTRTFRDREEGPWEFSAMVPESSLHEGVNDVQFFFIEAEQGALFLTPMLRSSSERFELATVEGQQVITAPGGETIQVQPEAFEGAYRNTGIVFEGWAENYRNRARRRAVDHILVFAQDEFLFSTTALRKVTFNPPFAALEGQPPLGPRRGFVVVVPSAVSKDVAQGHLKVFAVQGQLASQLEDQSR